MPSFGRLPLNGVPPEQSSSMAGYAQTQIQNLKQHGASDAELQPLQTIQDKLAKGEGCSAEDAASFSKTANDLNDKYNRVKASGDEDAMDAFRASDANTNGAKYVANLPEGSADQTKMKQLLASLNDNDGWSQQEARDFGALAFKARMNEKNANDIKDLASKGATEQELQPMKDLQAKISSTEGAFDFSDEVEFSKDSRELKNKYDIE